MATLSVAAILVVLFLSGVSEVRSDASDHRYKAGEAVPLYANKVGPFHNPRFAFPPSLPSLIWKSFDFVLVYVIVNFMRILI